MARTSTIGMTMFHWVSESRDARLSGSFNGLKTQNRLAGFFTHGLRLKGACSWAQDHPKMKLVIVWNDGKMALKD